jgi:carboxypeptidase Q
MRTRFETPLRLLPPSALATLLVSVAAARAPEDAPAPRPTAARSASSSAAKLDARLLEEIATNNEIMANLRHLSDVIGPRLTGSKNLETANNWAADRMKSYGLTNVHLEPWEIPVGWVRGPATMTLVEPNNGRTLMVAARGWTPGTNGKVTGPVVFLEARTKADLMKYKGKLKNAVVMRSAPSNVAPISDPSYGPVSGPPKKADPKKADTTNDDPKKDPKLADPKPGTPKPKGAKEDNPKKTDPKADPKKDALPRPSIGDYRALQRETDEFLKAEGVAATISDAGKPHSLLVTTGGWREGDRATQQATLPSLFMAHEHYALLYRLATAAAKGEGTPPRVELEITNTFVPGPIAVYNTVGEVKGSEKPDEFVVVGAHLDSWDLAQGTTDNGTGSTVTLEVARAIAKLAKEGSPPKRTIRFVLFTGEEQGLYGSKRYVERHKDEMPKTSVSLVHDTGTGKVVGFGLQGRAAVQKVLDGELDALKVLPGWLGLDLGNQGGTDHLSFEAVGVPGFACRQDIDEYRLTHHTQSDTFDKAKEPALIQGADAIAVTALRVANLPDLLPRERPERKKGRKE